MTRHEDRAIEFRAMASRAREAGGDASLANVREAHERAAKRWDALAELNDGFVEGALARRAARAEADLAFAQPLAESA